MADNIKRLMYTPKRHMLKHYMRRVGELYGETKENLDVYIDEQMKANEHDIEKALACFKDLEKNAPKI